MADYVLSIKIDDTSLDRALKKFQNGMFGGQSPHQSSSGGGIFAKLQQVLNKLSQSFGGGTGGKVAALGIMAIAVEGIFGIVKKVGSMVINASPMLSQMVKLLNTGIMFMLRPIGDFIGFMLQPIIMIFLRYVALPFYKYFAPFMQKYGTKLGDGLANLILLAIQFFTDPIGTITKAFQNSFGSIDVTSLFKGLPDFSKINLNGIAPAISTSLTNLIQGIKLPDFSGIFKGLPTVQKSWDQLTGFFSVVSQSISNLLLKPLGQLNDFFSLISSSIQKVLTPVWQGIEGFFNILTKGVNIILGFWGDLQDGFKAIVNVFIGVYNGIRNWASQLPLVGGGIGKMFPVMKAMANGGIINEPVIGVGQNSGHGYLLGENGAEAVTPLGKSGSSSGITININAPVYGVDNLKSIILTTMQQANSRSIRR